MVCLVKRLPSHSGNDHRVLVLSPKSGSLFKVECVSPPHSAIGSAYLCVLSVE